MKILGRNVSVLQIILVVIAITAVSSAVYNWEKPAQVVTRDQYYPVPVEKKVETIKRVAVPGPTKIITIEKEPVAKELDMPWLLDGGKPAPIEGKPKELQVVANADIPKSKGGTSAVAVTNTATGVTDIVVKEKPLPLFGFDNSKEIGVRYGVTTDKLQEGNIYGRWTFLRVGSLYLGGYGEIGTKPEAKAMLDLSYRW